MADRLIGPEFTIIDIEGMPRKARVRRGWAPFTIGGQSKFTWVLEIETIPGWWRSFLTKDLDTSATTNEVAMALGVDRSNIP